MPENFDVIVIFLIYGQFGAIRKPESGRIVCKTYMFINSNLFYFIKTENRTKKSLTQLSHYYCFLAKNADISKIKGAFVLRGIFFKTTYVCVLTYQMSREQGGQGIYSPPHLKADH